MDHATTIAHFFENTGMYIHKADYYTVTSFLFGYDLGSNCSVLRGFREWLVLKLKGGNNFVWTELFLRYAFSKPRSPRPKVLSQADHEKILVKLSETLETFFKERDTHDGLQRIHVRHAEWLKKQEGYAEAHEKAG